MYIYIKCIYCVFQGQKQASAPVGTEVIDDYEPIGY